HAGLDSSEMREGDRKPNRPVTAHANEADVIEKNHAGDAARIAWLAKQRADQHIRSPGLVDDGRAIVIMVGAKAAKAFGHAADAQIRDAVDHDARGLAGSMRIDDVHVSRLRHK